MPTTAREFINGVIGICIGIIFCAWWVGETSEQVAFIRFPATIILAFYIAFYIVLLAARIALQAARK